MSWKKTLDTYISGVFTLGIIFSTLIQAKPLSEAIEIYFRTHNFKRRSMHKQNSESYFDLVTEHRQVSPRVQPSYFCSLRLILKEKSSKYNIYVTYFT